VRGRQGARVRKPRAGPGQAPGSGDAPQLPSSRHAGASVHAGPHFCSAVGPLALTSSKTACAQARRSSAGWRAWPWASAAGGGCMQGWAPGRARARLPALSLWQQRMWPGPPRAAPPVAPHRPSGPRTALARRPWVAEGRQRQQARSMPRHHRVSRSCRPSAPQRCSGQGHLTCIILVIWLARPGLCNIACACWCAALAASGFDCR